MSKGLRQYDYHTQILISPLNTAILKSAIIIYKLFLILQKIQKISQLSSFNTFEDISKSLNANVNESTSLQMISSSNKMQFIKKYGKFYYRWWVLEWKKVSQVLVSHINRNSTSLRNVERVVVINVPFTQPPVYSQPMQSIWPQRNHILKFQSAPTTILVNLCNQMIWQKKNNAPICTWARTKILRVNVNVEQRH